jgi:ClpP class serine protease
MKDEARIAEEFRAYRARAEAEINRLKADVAFLTSQAVTPQLVPELVSGPPAVEGAVVEAGFPSLVIGDEEDIANLPEVEVEVIETEAEKKADAAESRREQRAEARAEAKAEDAAEARKQHRRK